MQTCTSLLNAASAAFFLLFLSPAAAAASGLTSPVLVALDLSDHDAGPQLEGSNNNNKKVMRIKRALQQTTSYLCPYYPTRHAYPLSRRYISDIFLSITFIHSCGRGKKKSQNRHVSLD